jgi:type VI secretion system protein VasJ
MSYFSKHYTYYLDLAQTPICHSSYAGEDARFSGEYEAIENELAKGHAMHQCGKIDWQKVLVNSEQLLRTRSKDLRVGAWLAWSLYQRESFQGLLAGFGLLRHFCEHHWADVYPSKHRTRSAAIGWIVPRLEAVITDDTVIKEQLPLFRYLAEHLEALDAVCTQYLEGGAPLLLPLLRRIKGLIQQATDYQPEPGGVDGAGAQIKHALSQTSALVPRIDTEKEAHKALRVQQDSGRSLCNWWLEQKATDIRALRLNRTLSWLPIEAMPDRDAAHITALRGMPAERLRAYQERYERGEYASLIVDVEASLAKAPFWFDGQRLVWDCLRGLNAELAMQEVEIQFGLLIHRLPDLIDSRFHDGVPFADAATRAWISANVMPNIQMDTSSGSIEMSHTQLPWELALEEAMPVLRKDGLKAAVQILKQGLQTANGGRVRFFWQYSMARLCFMAKKYELAWIQLETLYDILQASRLDTWEPELALEVLHLLHSCCEVLPQNPALLERKQEIYRRLCHLDLEVVLEKASGPQSQGKKPWPKQAL